MINPHGVVVLWATLLGIPVCNTHAFASVVLYGRFQMVKINPEMLITDLFRGFSVFQKYYTDNIAALLNTSPTADLLWGFN